MQRILKLQHHRHTGRRLEHHHTSYRGIAVVLVITGICMGLVQQASAETLFVNAKVSAQLPTVAATFSSPSNNTETDNSSIPISGTCEVMTPSAIVVITRGAASIGSTPCLADGTFELSVPLIPGTNTLLARTVNITDDYGPDSTALNILYAPVTVTPSPTDPADPLKPTTPPPSPPNSNTSNSIDPTTVDPLQIMSESSYMVFGPAKDAIWIGFFKGGTPPYSVVIDWGDSTIDTYSNVGTERLEYRHTYQNMQSSYFVTITVTDSSGQQTVHTFAAVTPFVGITQPLSILPTQTPFSERLTIAGLLYATYLLTVVTFGLIWVEATLIGRDFAYAQAHSLHRSHNHVRRKG